MHHQNLIKTKKPLLVFIGDSIAYRFKRYGNIWDNHFGNQIINCGTKRDRTENLIYIVEDLIIPQHEKKIVIICGKSNLDRDRPSETANALICSAILILLKQKQIKIIVCGIFPRNKENTFRRQKLLQINSILKEKCSQIPRYVSET